MRTVNAVSAVSAMGAVQRLVRLLSVLALSNVSHGQIHLRLLLYCDNFSRSTTLESKRSTFLPVGSTQYTGGKSPSPREVCSAGQITVLIEPGHLGSGIGAAVKTTNVLIHS